MKRFIPSHEGVILNELFTYIDKNHNRLIKYSIPSKLSLKAASNPVSMQLTTQLKVFKTARLPYLNSNLTTLQRSIVLCVNGIDSLQISSSVFDMMPPAWFIFDHVILSLFIATYK